MHIECVCIIIVHLNKFKLQMHKQGPSSVVQLDQDSNTQLDRSAESSEGVRTLGRNVQQDQLFIVFGKIVIRWRHWRLGGNYPFVGE